MDFFPQDSRFRWNSFSVPLNSFRGSQPAGEDSHRKGFRAARLQGQVTLLADHGFDSVERKGGKNMADATYEVQVNDAASEASVAKVDMKLEIVVIPVSDVDCAKEFYARLGWRLDADYDNGKDFRVIQFTPPGSGCSVIFGRNVTGAAPGSAQGLYLIVDDIEAARKNLLRHGFEVSEAFHGAADVYSGPDEPYLFGRIRVNGPDPEHRSYRSFASFRDPDGNGWLFQEITTRLPGRIDDTAMTFASANDLASAFRRAEAAHGEHEKRNGGQRDENWPEWYAAYMIAEQSGKELPQ
jgi:catechol 2,3-dioxygenase-like lactoylglutathione lyase family enzyme